MPYWTQVAKKTDIRARLLADRHYSRKTIGASNFTRPGNNIVLIVKDGYDASALWVSQRPDPKAGLDVRMDGFIYWNNSHFRNESGIQSSDLIREAVAITLGLWGGCLPKDGLHTFIDPRHVQPTLRRGEKFYGYCYLKAGFHLHPQRTRSGLWRWILPCDELARIAPVEPMREPIPVQTAFF